MATGGVLMDELKERRALEQGARAQGLLDNPLLHEAFAALEARYLSEWRNSMLDDVVGRERFWLAVCTIGHVRAHLQQIAAGGRLSEVQLQSLRQGGKP